jgi:hypothetical protein
VRRVNKWVISAAAVLVGTGVYLYGKWEGESDAVRLELLWPNLLTTMPPRDRALLGMLAQQCGLRRVAVEPAAVEACLREAAERPNVMMPRGFKSAPRELDRLLRQGTEAAPSQ